MTIDTTTIDTPIGRARVAAVDGKLVALTLASGWTSAARRLRLRFPGAPMREMRDTAGVRSVVRAYFAGDLRALDEVEVDPGGTAFQRRTWSALRAIAAGDTASYASLAAATRAPRAVRAIGTAMGANPIWIVQPCHRVVRSDGSLGGYAGGLQRKRWLLDHERANA